MSKTNREPSIGEKRFAQEALLGGEPPLWMQWVTKRKRDKIQDRLLVIGKYRVFSIKRTLTGKKQIQRVGHVFDLKELFSADVDKLVFKFKDFDIDVQAPGAGTDLVYQLRVNWQTFTCSFADYALPKITLLPLDRQLVPLPNVDPGPCHGFLATYEAFCAYYRLAPSQEFMKFINDVNMKGLQELNLDECPGIERKVDPINFIPIKCALRHNTYFTTFSCKNILRREVAECLSDTLMHNITLKKLVLSGIDAREEAFVAIGNSLKRNQLNSIVDMDFSNNLMKDKGGAGIADGLQFLTHSIFRLNVSNCGLSPKGIASILQSFCFGKEAAKNLTELDVSHNSVGQAGSVQLSNWFNQTTVNSQLRFLIMSNTKIESALVFRTMKNATVRSIEEIDVSGNKLDVSGAQALCAVIDTLPRLQVLNASYCNLQPLGVEGILRSIANNPSLNDVTINISGNEVGVPGALSVAQVLLQSFNFGALIMKGCGFKKEGLAKIIDSLGQNTERTTLKAIDLSLNFASGTSSKVLKLMSSLGEAVKRHPTLEYLGIAGNNEKLAIGKEIEPFLKSLGANPRLVELDISGNKIGDQMAVVLCDQLRTNTNLRSLSWDFNNISIGGYRALLNILSSNRNLLNCPTPVFDVDKSIKEAKNKEQFRDKTKEVLDSIRDFIKQNSGNQPYLSIIKLKQGKTYGENFKQFLALGTSSTGSDGHQLAFDSTGSGNNLVSSYGSMPNEGGGSSDYYRPMSPPQIQDSYASPPPTPSNPTPVHYGTMNGRNNSGYEAPTPSYDAPPPPPPPPFGAKTKPHATEDYDEPPQSNEYENNNQQYDYAAPSYDYPTEFDDSQYDETPPPPPPPPF